jgi:hypothetical protein
MLLIYCLNAALFVGSNLVCHNHPRAMAGVQISGPGVPSAKFPIVDTRQADILVEFVVCKEANPTWFPIPIFS